MLAPMPTVHEVHPPSSAVFLLFQMRQCSARMVRTACNRFMSSVDIHSSAGALAVQGIAGVVGGMLQFYRRQAVWDFLALRPQHAHNLA